MKAGVSNYGINGHAQCIRTDKANTHAARRTNGSLRAATPLVPHAVPCARCYQSFLASYSLHSHPWLGYCSTRKQALMSSAVETKTEFHRAARLCERSHERGYT